MKERREGFALRRFTPGLHHNRFDLAFKLGYLDGREVGGSEFLRGLYSSHIRAFSLGEMSEPGNDQKTDLDAFVTGFDEILADLQENGFDPERSLVPLASDGSILNGAHRCAAAMQLGMGLTGVETGLDPVRYDWRFFQARGMTQEDLDAAAIAYVRHAPQAAIALLWPAAGRREGAVEDILGGFAYRKDLKLSARGARNLLAHVYANEPWLGTPEEDFPGIDAKLIPCFAGTQPLRALVFDRAPGMDLIAEKDRVRALFGIGKHSIHITDTHEEAVMLARMLFNQQSVFALEHAQPARFPQVRTMALDLALYLRDAGQSPDDAVIDSGMVMGLFGLRAPSDIDYLAPESGAPSEAFEWHDTQRHGALIGDLMYDPEKHFHFWGMRFVSLPQIAAMKASRMAGRDSEDLAQIAMLLDSRPGTRRINGLIYALRFARSRLRHRLIALLVAMGVKEQVKMLRDRLQSRNR
ncbi:hypothetical protein [Aestuariicoccus sp. MJ-SS9]|uniref:hypothetical protein n=1 Tax=Aestuariicoccus sp. MJ-SS9 TaxID=3079855 RepID=UPI002907A5DD|nr:hypothetical protein [Aestuariicoccus sp. MJ-SS9]MDU8913851.1 hypothetical protein [Aestuariicoccus sp. MJ-SS9]